MAPFRALQDGIYKNIFQRNVGFKISTMLLLLPGYFGVKAHLQFM